MITVILLTVFRPREALPLNTPVHSEKNQITRDLETLCFSVTVTPTNTKKPKSDNELLQQSITGNIHLIQKKKKKRALMTLHVMVSKF